MPFNPDGSWRPYSPDEIQQIKSKRRSAPVQAPAQASAVQEPTIAQRLKNALKPSAIQQAADVFGQIASQAGSGQMPAQAFPGPWQQPIPENIPEPIADRGAFDFIPGGTIEKAQEKSIGQQILDALAQLGRGTGETLKYLGEGATESFGLNKILAAAATTPQNIEKVPEQFKDQYKRDFAPENLVTPVEEAQDIPQWLAEAAKTAGGMAPYILGAPAFGALEGVVSKGVGGLAGKVAPRLARSPLGKKAVDVAGRMAGMGTSFGTVGAVHEAMDALANPEEFDPLAAAGRVMGKVGTGILFGGVSGTVGQAARGAIGRRLPGAMAPTVAGTLQRGAIAGAGGLATGSTQAGINTLTEYLSNPEQFDADQAAGNALKEGLFFAGLEAVMSLLHGRYGASTRIAGKKQPRLTPYEFTSGSRDPASEGYREFRPGSGLWMMPGKNDIALFEVAGYKESGEPLYKHEVWRVQRTGVRPETAKPPAQKPVETRLLQGIQQEAKETIPATAKTVPYTESSVEREGARHGVKSFEGPGGLNDKAVYVGGKVFYPSELAALPAEIIKASGRPALTHDLTLELMKRIRNGDPDDMAEVAGASDYTPATHITKTGDTISMRLDTDGYLRKQGILDDMGIFNQLYDTVKTLKADGHSGRLEIPELQYRGTIDDFLGVTKERKTSGTPTVSLQGRKEAETIAGPRTEPVVTGNVEETVETPPKTPKPIPQPKETNTLPFGKVSSEDESRYFGSEVTLLGKEWRGRKEPDHDTTVVRVLNGGALIEVRNPNEPDNPQATLRVSGDSLVTRRVVDNNTEAKAEPEPKPTPKPESGTPYVPLGDLVEHYKSQGLSRELAWNQYVKDTILSNVVRTEKVDAKDVYAVYDRIQAGTAKANPKYPLTKTGTAPTQPLEPKTEPTKNAAIAGGVFKHFTTKEGKSALESGAAFDWTIDPQHGTGDLGAGPKTKRFIPGKYLYLSLDDKRWGSTIREKAGGKIVEATDANKGQGVSFYDYDKQKWMRNIGGHEQVNLEPVEYHISPKAKVLVIDSAQTLETTIKQTGLRFWDTPKFWETLAEKYDVVAIRNVEKTLEKDPDNKFFKSADADQLIVLNPRVAEITTAAPKTTVIAPATPKAKPLSTGKNAQANVGASRKIKVTDNSVRGFPTTATIDGDNVKVRTTLARNEVANISFTVDEWNAALRKWPNEHYAARKFIKDKFQQQSFLEDGGAQVERIVDAYVKATKKALAQKAFAGASTEARAKVTKIDAMRGPESSEGYITLYRAAKKENPYLGQWSAWAEKPSTAKAYTDNPGFGGPRIYKAKIKPEYVLDLSDGSPASRKTFETLAEALYDTTIDPETGRSEAQEALEEWDHGYVYQTWENDTDVAKRLAKHYGWVKYQDDYPAGSITWVSLEKEPVKAATGKTPKAPAVTESSAGIDAMRGKRPATSRPVPGQAATLEPVKRRALVKMLEKRLGAPIRVGRFRIPDALGIYKRREQVIRTKLAEDIGTIAHEEGHHLDQQLHLQDQAYDSELLPLGQVTSPKKANSDYLRKEGVAEFVRLYLMDPKQAQSQAPKYYEFFEKRMAEYQDIHKVLLETRADYSTWLNQPAKARILGSMSVNEPEKRRAITLTQLYAQAVDELEPLRKVTKELTGGQTLPTGKDPFLTAWLARGWAGRAETFLHHGPVDSDYNKTGPGLQEILEPVKDRLDDFRAYIVAKRAKELASRKVNPIPVERSIGSGVDETDVDEILNEFKEFETTQKQLVEFQDAVLNELVDSGVVSADAAKAMRAMNHDYVPFYRLFDDSVGTLQFKGARRFANLSSPISSIKGSGRTMLDPLESIIKNTYTMINIAQRNQVGKSLIELAEEQKGMGRLIEKVDEPLRPVSITLKEIKKALETNGVDTEGVNLDALATVFRPTGRPSAKENMITVYRGGEPEFYQVDPELYRSLLSLDAESAPLWQRMLSYPASLLRAGATLSPDFIARNPIRDQWTAFIFSKYNMVPGVDLMRGLFHAIKQDDLYWKWKAAGGAHATMVSVDRDYLQKSLRALLNEKRGLTGVLMHPVEALRSASEFMEEATRLGEFTRGVKTEGENQEGIRKSALASRDITVDFGRAGHQGKQYNRLVAFFNAAIQGTDKMAREFKANPVRSTAKAVLSITLPSLLLYLLNRENPEYEEKRQWEKDLFWLVPLGDPKTAKRFLYVPKPFELGIIFGTVPERIFRWIDREDPNAFKGVAKVIGEAALPNVVPTAMLPIIETYAANRSFLTGAPIVPRREEKLQSNLQYGENTSETAKLIGKAANLSPRQIDHLVRGYTGGLGQYGVSASDALLKATGAVDAREKPDRGLRDIPVVRSFVRDSSGTGKSIDQFYDKLEEAEKVFGSIEKRKTEGEKVVPTAKERDILNRRRALLETSRNLAKLRGERSAVETGNLTPAQKKQEIERLNREMTTLARQTLDQGIRDIDLLADKLSIAEKLNQSISESRRKGNPIKIQPQDRELLSQLPALRKTESAISRLKAQRKRIEESRMPDEQKARQAKRLEAQMNAIAKRALGQTKTAVGQ